MFAEFQPDVVLMDLQLPDIDGFAAAAQIVAMSADVRVIMLTAQVTAQVLAEAAASGICGFLAKDGHFGDLLTTLRTAERGGLAVNAALLTRCWASHEPRPDDYRRARCPSASTRCWSGWPTAGT